MTSCSEVKDPGIVLPWVTSAHQNMPKSGERYLSVWGNGATDAKYLYQNKTFQELMARYALATTATRANRARVSQRAARQAVASALRAPSRAMPPPRLPMRPETKYVWKNLYNDFASIGTTWAEASFMGIAQGTNVDQRVGNKIAISSFNLHGVLAQGSNGSSLDDQYNVVRVIVALWKQPAGTTPLANYNTNVNTSSFHAPITRNTTAIGSLLVKKLLDQYIPLEVTSTERASGDGYCPGLQKLDLYYKFKKPFVVTYYSSSSSLTQTSTGADFYLTISFCSDSSATVNPGFVAGYAVMNYVDI